MFPNRITQPVLSSAHSFFSKSHERPPNIPIPLLEDPLDSYLNGSRHGDKILDPMDKSTDKIDMHLEGEVEVQPKSHIS